MLFSQTDTQRSAKPDFLNKSKKQKKTANILLAGGGGLVVAAFVFPRGGMDSPPAGSFIYFTTYKNDGLKGGLLVAGVLSMLTSIPFYISSAGNKRKANAITINIDNRDLLFGTCILIRQPAVVLKVRL